MARKTIKFGDQPFRTVKKAEAIKAMLATRQGR